MKFRVRPGEVEIATIQGEPVVRAVGSSTLQAVKRLRRLIDTLADDPEWRGHRQQAVDTVQ